MMVLYQMFARISSDSSGRLNSVCNGMRTIQRSRFRMQAPGLRQKQLLPKLPENAASGAARAGLIANRGVGI
jgi:hypothetical protein